MKKILFIANNRMILSGMLFLIEEFQKKYSYEITPILICEFCYYETDKYQVINLSEELKGKSLGTLNNSVVDFYNQERRKLRKQIYQFFSNYHRMNKDDRMSKKILNNVKPDALVVADDRMGGILQGFLKNAKDMPIIRVPVAIQYDYRKGFSMRYYNCELILTDKFLDINRILLLINKSWIRCVGHEYRTFYSLGYTLAGWIKNMISMHPWVSGGGVQNNTCISSL